jgi:hypothetical protein
MQSKDEIIELLQSSIIVVEFNKKNGEFRRMTCTLNLDIIPQDKIPKTTQDYANKNNTAVRCFDIDANDWRSFIVDNVTKVENLDA